MNQNKQPAANSNMNTEPKFFAIQRKFLASIRDPNNAVKPDDIPNERLQVYQNLIHDGIDDILSSAFPVLYSILEKDHWQEMINEFIIKHRSIHPIYYEIPQEFLTYLQNERDLSKDPEFIYELAHYEWMELKVELENKNLPTKDIQKNGDLLQQEPAVSPLAFVVQYHFPVQQIGPNFIPDKPSEKPIFLIVYRDHKDKVGFMEINSMTARLIELLQKEKLTGMACLQKIAKELQHPNEQVVIQGGLQILQQLQQHDIILGTWKH